MDVGLLEGEGPGLPLPPLVPDPPLVILGEAPVRGVTRQARVTQHQGRAHGGGGGPRHHKQILICISSNGWRHNPLHKVNVP